MREIPPHVEKLLQSRYYLRSESGELLENSIEQMYKRVSHAVAQAEHLYPFDDMNTGKREFNAAHYEQQFYNLMVNNKFIPATPILMNAGKENGGLSSCFVLPIEDSMEGIFETLKNFALIAKAGGGVGYNFSNLREKGAVVSSTGHGSSGPITFMRVFNEASEVIKQGGCFIGDTKIATVHGPTKIKDLNKGELVYCWEGKYILSPCTQPFKTQEKAEVWRLETDKGLVVFATPNHPIMRREGKHGVQKSFTELSQLKPGMAIMPFTRYQKPAHEEREWFITLHDGKDSRIPEHNLVANAIFSNVEGTLVHHKNGDHLDNFPENLELHTKSTHASLHGKKKYEEGTHPFLTLTKEQKDTSVDSYKKWHLNLSDENKDTLKIKQMKGMLASIAWTLLNNGHSILENHWKTSISSLPKNRRYKKETVIKYFGSWDIFLEYLDINNHKVLSIKFSHYEDVYNVEVPEVHNYVVCNDDMTSGILVSNSRRAASIAILNIDHSDIEDFISCKDDGVSLTSFNISVAVTSNFMDAVANNHNWFGKPAKDLWNKICEHAWKTGEPGIIFIDTVNDKYPFDNRRIISTNPCGELPLEAYSACALSSMNLLAYYKDGDFDFKEFTKDIPVCVRFLDNLLDINHYPIPEIGAVVKELRQIGLGLMGWADLLIEMKIPYDSENAIVLLDDIGEIFETESFSASMELAKERGNFPAWKESKYYPDVPMRNSTRTTIAPTGSISRIAGVSSSIEPNYAWSIQHNLDDLSYTETHDAWKKVYYALPSDEFQKVPKYMVTAKDISPEWHLRHLIEWQKYIDSSISKTINAPSSATIEDVANVYMKAWKSGVKGITVYRDGSRNNQPLQEISSSPTFLKTDGVEIKDDGSAKFYDRSVMEDSVEDMAKLANQYEFIDGEWKIPTNEAHVAMRSLAESMGADSSQYLYSESNPAKNYRKRGKVSVGVTHKVDTGKGKIYITVNYDRAQADPVEVFIRLGPSSTPREIEMADWSSRMLSLCLKYNVPISAITRQSEKIYGDGSFIYQGKFFNSLPQLIAHLIKPTWQEVLEMVELEDTYYDPEEGWEEKEIIQPVEKDTKIWDTEDRTNKEFCYSCSTWSVVKLSGCKTCLNCGDSICG